MTSEFDRTSTFRSAMLITLSTYVNYAAGLLVSILLARKLGPREYGQYAYFIWLAGTLTTLFCNGLTFSGIRFVSERLGGGDKAGARAVHGLLTRWFAAGLLVVSLSYVLASPWLLPSGWERPVWFFAIAALLAGGFKATYLFGSSISKGYGRFDIDANTTNAMSLLTVVGVIVLVALNASLQAYMVFFVAMCVGHVVLARLFMQRASIIPGQAEVSDELRARIMTHFLWGTGLFVVYAFSNKSIENFFLNAHVGPEAVGWFAIAAAMARGGIDMLVSGLSTVLMPVMSHAFGSQDRARAYRIFSDAVRYYFFLGIVLAGVGFLWAGPAITILYGAQYAPAILALQVMVLIGGLTLVDGATSAILATTDNQAARVGLAILTLFVTCAAAVLLIPSLGFVGALWAHAIARMVYFIVSLMVAARLLHFVLPFRELARSIAAAAIGATATAPVLLLSSGITAQVVAGVCYACACLAASVWLNSWTKNDFRVLSSIADRVAPLRAIAQWLSARARNS